MKPAPAKTTVVFGNAGHWAPVGALPGNNLPGGFAFAGLAFVTHRTRFHLRLTGATLHPAARAHWARLLVARRNWLRFCRRHGGPNGTGQNVWR